MAQSEEIDELTNSLYDSSDSEFVNARKAAAGRKQQRLDMERLRLMSSQAGRELVWEWLAGCGIHRTSYAENPIAMAFNEGQRNRGLVMEAEIIRVAPADYSKMVVEAQIRERAEQEREKRLKEKKNGRNHDQ